MSVFEKKIQKNFKKISKNKIGRSAKASKRAVRKMLFSPKIDYFDRKFRYLGGFLDLK